jgi:hypothetical protein
MYIYILLFLTSQTNTHTQIRLDIFPSLNYHEVFFPYKCKKTISSPVVSIFFFLSFLFLASFITLSLFIGAVTMGMTESIQQQEKEMKERKLLQRQWDSRTNEKSIRTLLAAVKYMYMKCYNYLCFFFSPVIILIIVIIVKTGVAFIG